MILLLLKFLIHLLLRFFIHLVMMLNTLRFKSSVLFGIHILLDKSLRVLQVPKHLSDLIENR